MKNKNIIPVKITSWTIKTHKELINECYLQQQFLLFKIVSIYEPLLFPQLSNCHLDEGKNQWDQWNYQPDKRTTPFWWNLNFIVQSLLVPFDVLKFSNGLKKFHQKWKNSISRHHRDPFGKNWKFKRFQTKQQNHQIK